MSRKSLVFCAFLLSLGGLSCLRDDAGSLGNTSQLRQPFIRNNNFNVTRDQTTPQKNTQRYLNAIGQKTWVRVNKKGKHIKGNNAFFGQSANSNEGLFRFNLSVFSQYPQGFRGYISPKMYGNELTGQFDQPGQCSNSKLSMVYLPQGKEYEYLDQALPTIKARINFSCSPVRNLPPSSMYIDSDNMYFVLASDYERIVGSLDS